MLHLVLDQLDAQAEELRWLRDRVARLEAEVVPEPTDSWKPTVVMGRVWQALDASTVPLTASALSSLVHSEPRDVKEAITRLIAEGFIGETGKRPRTLRIVKPYTELASTPLASRVAALSVRLARHERAHQLWAGAFAESTT